MSSGSRRGPGRPALPTEQQRERLLLAASRTLRGDPNPRISVLDIVREAGMSTRSFYECFGSKDELLLSLIRVSAERFIARIDAAFSGLEDPSTAIGPIIEAYLELVPLITLDRATLAPETAAAREEIRHEYFARLRDGIVARLQQGVEAGLMRRVPDPTVIDIIILGVEALTMRYHEEGRLEELAGLQPQLLEAFVRLTS
ncbi:MAG: hypothetical protein CL910_18755 [Deltaproteobacteria bacterium]|nr:hypothetical protein [Deltaproteobacteria bacterium]